MNREILEIVQAKLAENPSWDLNGEIRGLAMDALKKHFAHPTAKLLQERRKPPPPKPQNFTAVLVRSPEKTVILNPLSDAAKTLIFGAIGEEDGGVEDEDSLDKGVRRVLRHAEVIAKLSGRGGVLRCGDGSGSDIAIKVVPASETTAFETEYSALLYLAENAPDFPAPKPHGLIGLGDSRLMLMSYIPSTTLKSVWPTLSDSNKLSIQRQLNQIFMRLREFKQKDRRLGGLGGEGVSDHHAWVDHADTETVMTTATEFRDFQFSIKAPCGPEYAAFLKSLLPHPDPDEPAVFTHGDFFPGNIMVDLDPTRAQEYVVSGIVDWETSGFYPAWFEASKVLYTFNESGRGTTQDWWKYVPSCIAPASRLLNGPSGGYGTKPTGSTLKPL